MPANSRPAQVGQHSHDAAVDAEDGAEVLLPVQEAFAAGLADGTIVMPSTPV